jgi:ubiquinone/menaquinone biosynthesis C-methylase UbiE
MATGLIAVQRRLVLFLLLLGIAGCAEVAPIATASAPLPAPTIHPGYLLTQATHEGLGKYYLGREIAHFMSHQGASWLERPEREQEERPDLLMAAIALKPGDVVADIGCGTGYYSWRMADKVGPQGKVIGVEIQAEMLTLFTQHMVARKLTNTVAHLGTTTDPKLPPASVDVIVLVDAYHEFDHPFEMMQAMIRALKLGGRIILVEYRAEDARLLIGRTHKMSAAQIKREMSIHPVQLMETMGVLPQQHVLIYRKS